MSEAQEAQNKNLALEIQVDDLKQGCRDLEVELDKIISDAKSSGVEIKWNHVKGHANIQGNVEADRLAVLGAQMKN